MMRLAPEPEHTHGPVSGGPRTAILLCNLGTPSAATAPALRRYLAEFLADRRVVEIPRLAWWPILHGVILRIRPARSARKYASIWTPEGSPLAVWIRKQALMLQGYLGERRCRVTVRHAMRYGEPSIPHVLDELKAAGATRVLVLPLYPQYASSTTAAVVDAVGTWATRQRVIPELRFVNHYHDDPGYIEALAKSVIDHATIHGLPQKLVLSFHGVPRRTLEIGDPYHCECQKTARLLTERLRFQPGQVIVTFQSRFGKAEWLQPYTEPTLVALARAGNSRVDVMCPGFSADCLETLEEIDQEARQAFLTAGGSEFHYIPCLNARHEWMVALSEIAMRNLQGWPTSTEDAAERTRQRERALGMGAAR
jgi:ferrochelatase